MLGDVSASLVVSDGFKNDGLFQSLADAVGTHPRWVSNRPSPQRSEPGGHLGVAPFPGEWDPKAAPLGALSLPPPPPVGLPEVTAGKSPGQARGRWCQQSPC